MSLQDRAAQRAGAKRELLARVRRDPGPPVCHRFTITDEELAYRQVRQIRRVDGWWPAMLWATTSSTTPVTYTDTWQPYSTATTSTTTGTGWVSYYDPVTYTTTFTTSAADAAYWAGWNTQYTDTEEARAARELAELDGAERLAALQRAEAERVARHREQRAQAERTARELLLAHLDARQKRDLLEFGSFEVIGSAGRRWRIRTDGSYMGNVDLMPAVGEVRLATYCAHSPDQLPRSDHFLIQKIVLEADEDAFLAVANLQHYDPAVYDADPTAIPDRRRARLPAADARGAA